MHQIVWLLRTINCLFVVGVFVCGRLQRYRQITCIQNYLWHKLWSVLLSIFSSRLKLAAILFHVCVCDCRSVSWQHLHAQSEENLWQVRICCFARHCTQNTLNKSGAEHLDSKLNIISKVAHFVSVHVLVQLSMAAVANCNKAENDAQTQCAFSQKHIIQRTMNAER